MCGRMNVNNDSYMRDLIGMIGLPEKAPSDNPTCLKIIPRFAKYSHGLKTLPGVVYPMKRPLLFPLSVKHFHG